MGNIATEVRQTVRGLARAPWYSSTILTVMTLGMTLATTVFAVVDGVLFKPIALPEPGRLFAVFPGFKNLPPPSTYRISFSAKDIADWSVAIPNVAFTAFSAQPWEEAGEDVQTNTVGVVQVQSNVFDVLGVRPMIGGFTADDFDHEAAMRPVVITYDAWRGRFRGDTNVVGREMETDHVRHQGRRIVGVMPRGFVFPTDRAAVSYITPKVDAAPDASLDPSRRGFSEVIARVPAGMSVDVLRERIEAGMAMTAAAFPPLGPRPAGWSDANWRREGPFDYADATPLSQSLGSQSRPLFRSVFLAVALLVAIGGLNVSGLLAARTLDRRRDLALRRRLGASTASIARLILIESFLLIGAGSIMGLVAARPLLALTLSLLPEEIVLLKTTGLDWRVAAFVTCTAVLMALATALGPVLRASRHQASGDADARASEPTRSTSRSLIIGAQVAGGFVLTLGGSLLVNSLFAVYANALPIRTSQVVLIEASLQGPGAIMRKSPERNTRVAPLIDRLRRVPGVGAVGMTSAELLRGGSWGSRFKAPAGAGKLSATDIDLEAVTSDYYRVIAPQLVAGRLPTDDELSHDARVLVVSKTLAQTYWPTASAIGQTLVESDNPDPYTVVGVVRDVRWFSWDKDTASIYGPYALLSRDPMLTFLIDARGDAGRVMGESLRALHDADPLLDPERAGMLDEVFVESVRPRRFQAWLFGSFAAAGLTIVGVGMLGLLAMATARRIKEFGIRHALGATPFGIIHLLILEQLPPVIAGLVAGALISMWAVTFVQGYLYRVTVHDPQVWIIAGALLVVAAGLGAIIPAVRASLTDPVQALRVD